MFLQAQAIMADVAPPLETAVKKVIPAVEAPAKEVTPSTLQFAPRKIDPKFDREWYVDSKVLR